MNAVMREKKMRTRFWPPYLLLFLCLSTGCGKSLSTLNRLAAAGAIQSDAPVKTEQEIEIGAPPARVWAVLIDAASWPKWQHGIDQVGIAGPLASGARFSWRTGGMEIHSQVQLFEPEQKLGWTGTALTAKAIHIWELRGEPGGRTLVIVKESMEGPGLAIFYSSKDLTQADRDWLLALKRATEGNSAQKGERRTLSLAFQFANALSVRQYRREGPDKLLLLTRRAA